MCMCFKRLEPLEKCSLFGLNFVNSANMASFKAGAYYSPQTCVMRSSRKAILASCSKENVTLTKHNVVDTQHFVIQLERLCALGSSAKNPLPQPVLRRWTENENGSSASYMKYQMKVERVMARELWSSWRSKRHSESNIFADIVAICRAFCACRTQNGAAKAIRQRNMLNWADIRKRIDAVASTTKRARFG